MHRVSNYTANSNLKTEPLDHLLFHITNHGTRIFSKDKSTGKLNAERNAEFAVREIYRRLGIEPTPDNIKDILIKY
ncbi:MAG: hypothetical protein KAR42_17760 [candidate division Zixibacteria bacterium]|nr:hypothetical protein [candidate division Zixibacteria bacterium]